MVKLLAFEGFSVIAVARTFTSELAAAIAEVEAARSGALAFRSFDLNETGEIHSFVRELRQSFGKIYGLVNNAGLGGSGALVTMPEAKIEALVRLNTIAPIMLTKSVLKPMLSAGAGRIVNVSSIVSTTGYSGLSAYAATKASMIGFTKSLAREVGRLGITVNAVAPGFIDTEMTRELEGADRERIVRRTALKRLAEPEDVAAAVGFLLSERARHITGTVLTVDAGATA